MNRAQNVEAELAFELARGVALQSDFHKAHVGCIITYKGRPIATGHNSNKTHPMQKKYNKYRENDQTGPFIHKLHAEIQALAKLKKELNPKKMSIYIYRTRKDQDFGLARPCPSCMKAIYDSGIRNVFYTTNYGFAHEIIREEDML